VEFTLLLNGLEQLQHRVVPVEDRMAQSRFKLPLHVPFRAIAQLINRTLVPQATGAELEAWLQREALSDVKELRKRYDALEHETDPKAVYGTLDHEANERERLHGVCMETYRRAVDIEVAMREAFHKGQRQAVDQCDAALRYVREHAEHITSSSKSLVDEVDRVEARGIAVVDADATETARLIKEAEYRAKRARKNQETAARQAREAMKAFHKEQQAHAAAIADVARHRVDAARLDAARKQFVSSCHERREILADAHRACLFVNDVIHDVSEEVRNGLTLCQQHVSRMLAEEGYRKVRIATQPMHNARDWFRAVGDLKTIRNHRRTDIERRMEGSWQLEFLLSQEAQAHTAAISELDSRLDAIQREWAALTAVLVDLEVHVPVLHQYDKDARVVAMRAAFTALEGVGKDKDMREAHRKLLAIEAAEAEERQRTLPPMPPVRTSKLGKPKQKQLATDVRLVPRPPSAGSESGGAKTSRPPSGSKKKTGSSPSTARLATPPETQQAAAAKKQRPSSRGRSTPPRSTTTPPPILPHQSPRGARPLPVD